MDSTASTTVALSSVAPERTGSSAPAAEPSQTVRVAVASSDSLRRRRLVGALEAERLSVCFQADSPEALCNLATELVGTVVVIAADVSEPATVAGMRRIRALAPDTPIVIVSASSHGTGVRRALNAGADGFVLEARLEETLTCTVRAVLQHQVCAPRELRRWIAKPSFTNREKQILALLAAGASNKEIANQLFLAESTVKSHLASLFGKLGVRSRTDAAAIILDPQEGLQTTALPLDPAAIRSLFDPTDTPYGKAT
jgi:DNA-binding NarL/FixJ family response regulator